MSCVFLECQLLEKSYFPENFQFCHSWQIGAVSAQGWGSSGSGLSVLFRMTSECEFLFPLQTDFTPMVVLVGKKRVYFLTYSTEFNILVTFLKKLFYQHFRVGVSAQSTCYSH